MDTGSDLLFNNLVSKIVKKLFSQSVDFLDKSRIFIAKEVVDEMVYYGGLGG